MIDSKKLLKDLQGRVKLLEDDLRARCKAEPEVVDAPLRARYDVAKKKGRTAFTYAAWREDELTQVAVAWVLACVFVRFLEDNELVDVPKLAGVGERLKRAQDEGEHYFSKHPTNTERDYLIEVFEEVGKLPAMKEFFDRKHNMLWEAGPTGDACRELLLFWQKTDAETGDVMHDFTDPEWGTRFLGDLYQDLSEAVRKKYALLQTPDFVEEFILDRTLTPAIETFGYREVRMIDPTCGSGHFLLGGFERLLKIWQNECPGENPRVLAQNALDSVYGVDLNPYAVAVARFRLLLVALQASGVKKLKNAPDFKINLAVGDSLIHGARFDKEGQAHQHELQGTFDSNEELFKDEMAHFFDTEDSAELHCILGQQYHAVVGNPPYITVKDKALNSLYRQRYKSCYRKYSLSVPFMERFFDLAYCGSPDEREPSGFIGQITANSFMKAVFGKHLIEKVLTNLEITHVLDTGGAYLPGHGTATCIIFGRSGEASNNNVRVAMGIQAEPEIPLDPALGLVWLALLKQVDLLGSESKFFSISDISRRKLDKHPWNLSGGGATDLKDAIEDGSEKCLECYVTENGVFGITAADDAFSADEIDFRRINVEPSSTIRFVAGDEVRDWSVHNGDYAIFPYHKNTILPILDKPMWFRWLWPMKTELGNRATFEKKTYFEEGRPWWGWHQVAFDRLSPAETITYPFVNTHTHFVYERERMAYNRPAPILKFKDGTKEDLYQAMVAILNASSVCFWLKQICQPKGGSGIGRGIQSEIWEGRLSYNASAIAKIPVPKQLPKQLGQMLDQAVQNWKLTEAEKGSAQFFKCFAKMISLQEELDWHCYRLYGLTDTGDDLEWPEDRLDDLPALTLGERAFEIRMARQMATGELETAWFDRHKEAGSKPTIELPGHWPDDYRALVERRLAFTEANKNISLIERPEYKRRWNTEPWEKRQTEALRKWLLTRLEGYFFEGSRVCEFADGFDPGRHRFPAASQPHLVTVNQLADVVQHDAKWMEAAEVYHGASGFKVSTLLQKLVGAEIVPFLPGLRYKESGLRKREDWEQTWEKQRAEDVVEAKVREQNSGKNEEKLKELIREEQVEQVGDIPVPPKYAAKDFKKPSYWKMRGKLDVPKERWISYPDCGRDHDTSELIAWAGWDHAQQAQALAAYYMNAKQEHGWSAEKLLPLLAGIKDLLPWLNQWHNDPNNDYGVGLGDFYTGLLDDACRELDLNIDDVESARFSEL